MLGRPQEIKIILSKDIKYMRHALIEAEKAKRLDEVPIGAVLVDHKERILARSYNRIIHKTDPTAHAEILLLRKAAKKIKNYRLLRTTLYVTIEPCIMCMGAIVHARVARVVFGAKDIKWGAAGSLYNFADDKRLNHKIEVTGGVCETECKTIIQQFFRKKRV